MRDSVIAVIQARTGSARLPGKVLLPLGDRTVLDQMVKRVQRCKLIDDVVVATTTLPEDTAIVTAMAARGVTCVRGHPTDLLDRHYNTALATSATHIVKIPSDCPLVDPAIIDAVVLAYLGAAGPVDYASNLHPATHPDGNDVEIMSRRALEQAWHEATQPWQREHTTPFIWDQPDRFRTINACWTGGRDASATHRYVLDYPEDYDVIRAVFDALYRLDPRFDIAAIVEFLDANPDLAALNAHRRGTAWYEAHRHELRTLQRVPA